MYLTYEDYLEMGGSIPSQAAYAPYAQRAEHKADYYTQGRIRQLTAVPEAVRQTIFRLTELFWGFDNGGGIRSCGNDGVSVTYADAPPLDLAALQIIRETLPRQLTCRGVER